MQGLDVIFCHLRSSATRDFPFTMQCFQIHVFSTKPEGGIFLSHPQNALSKP